MKVKYGYMGKLLFVNLNDGTIQAKDQKQQYYQAMGFDPITGEILGKQSKNLD